MLNLGKVNSNTKCPNDITHLEADLMYQALELNPTEIGQIPIDDVIGARRFSEDKMIALRIFGDEKISTALHFQYRSRYL
ncbi:hypothetical protein D3C86_1341710 [compost metagenome]